MKAVKSCQKLAPPNLHSACSRCHYSHHLHHSHARTPLATPLTTSTNQQPLMAATPKFHHSLLLFMSAAVLLSAVTTTKVSALGINYGRVADNLPSPEDSVKLLKSIGATRVKLYDADPRVLKAFANTNIQVIIGLGNEYLSKMASDPSQALSWVKTNVQCQLPATKITAIALGNEVLTFNDTSLSAHLLPAMQNIQSALSNLHLDRQVCVTTPHSLGILESSYPPSSARFRPDLADWIKRIVEFHSKTGAPFLINAYPFLAYKDNPDHVSLDFVLFQADDNDVVVDPGTKLKYDNMLFAQIDAVHSALDKIGCKDVCVQISETGWPSKGDADEPGASRENAKRYNANLFKLMQQRKGTPLKPESNLNIYVFALYNENLKPGPISERNFGLFKPDGTPAYSLGLGRSASQTQSSGRNGTTTSPISSGDSPVVLSPPGGSSNGYMSITSDAGRLGMDSSMLLLVFCMVTSITVAVTTTDMSG